MMDNFKEAFREEAFELLSELETSLLELEQDPDNRETIERAFRALHTIKGSGAMAGFDDIAAFTHEVESVFEHLRHGRLAVTKELVDLTLAARDVIRGMLEPADNGDEGRDMEAKGIVRALKELLPAASACIDERVSQGPSESPAASDDVVTYRIFFRPHPDIFTKGTNPLLLLNELRQLGDCEVVAHPDDIPDLEELNPEECHTYWDVILTTREGINAVRDVFIFVEDDCELKVEAMDEQDILDNEPHRKKLGEILVERGDVAREDLLKVLGSQRRIGELLVDQGLADAGKVRAALAEQQHLEEIRQKRQQEEQASSIRVPAAKLDTLVDLVGELVTVQASLSQLASSRRVPELRSIAEHVHRLTAELRDNTMTIRMLPIGTTFNKFKRLVRDLSKELGKEIVLTTAGAETELDKTVIERLNDSLMHLIRNCIDHGIEPPDVRKTAGKTAHGTVHLSAVHSGANVLIRITDDGAGLDEEAVRKKAAEKGLIAPDAELSRKEIFSLIFAPGFSTAGKVTNVSGRGVGLDVVKRNIEALRGSIDIGSEKGVGTTVTLKLPLTLAIIDGLLVKVGKTFFVLPLSIVEECVELSREEVARAHGRHVALIRGEIIPYIRLRERFSINGDLPPIEQIVVTNTAADKVGFVVDKVMGEHQTVIKNLGKMYREVGGISGATILGDGTVALIMDVPKLLERLGLEKSRHE
jgi:two-component system chemotaxis sensor kinase CheA